MMIMRFHKLIQSRLMWLIFSGVVILSFVFMDAVGRSGDVGPTRQLRAPVAHLNGEPIRFLEFDTTRRLLERNLERNIPRDQLDELVFERFAMVAFAQSLGLDVPKSLARQEFFRSLADEDGQLEPEFVEMVLRSLRSEGLSEDAVVSFIRDEMLVQELRRILTSMVHVSSFDAERWATLQTDEFQLLTVSLDDSALEEETSVSDEELQRYFEENAHRFRIPEKRVAAYLKFPVADFMRDEEDRFSREDARAFYDQNPQRFSRGVPVENEDGTFEFTMEQIPFEEALEDIRDTFFQHLARERAEDEAMGLSVRLSPRRGRMPPAMESIAAEQNLEILTAGPFRAGDVLEGVSNPREFIQAAFDLGLNEMSRTSRPIVGRDAVYVMQLTEIVPPRDPELDEVREAVMQSAVAAARRKALAELAEARAEFFRSALAEGTSFEEAAKDLGLEVEQAPPVQLQSLNTFMPLIPPALAQELSGHKAGDLIGPIEDDRMGSLLIAKVVSRETRTEDRDNLVPQLRSVLVSELQFPGFLERFRDMTLLSDLTRVHTPVAEEENETL